MERNSKGFAPVYTLVILSVVVIGFYVAYRNFQSGQRDANPRSVPTSGQNDVSLDNQFSRGTPSENFPSTFRDIMNDKSILGTDSGIKMFGPFDSMRGWYSGGKLEGYLAATLYILIPNDTGSVYPERDQRVIKIVEQAKTNFINDGWKLYTDIPTPRPGRESPYTSMSYTLGDWKCSIYTEAGSHRYGGGREYFGVDVWCLNPILNTPLPE